MRARFLFLFYLSFLLFSCSVNPNKKLLGIISIAREIIVTNSNNSISYPSNLIFYVNSKVNISPTVQGSISSYTISPTLPTGLSIDNSTGVIQGTPTSISSATDYIVTAGTLTATLNLQVKNTTSSKVYGQLGSFTTGTANNGGRSANTLNSPRGVFVDTNNVVYIADTSNDRVLVYENNSTTATKVFGQQDGFTTGTSNLGGVSAQSLFNPRGAIRDKNNLLYIFDTDNNRLLLYPDTSTTANDVYGQNNVFTTNTLGISSTQFDSPFSAIFDSSNNLYVADYNNNRILFFPSNNKTASIVYGQQGSFISNTANNGGISSSSLDSPIGVQIDQSNGLYVADYSNNRILYFPKNATTATIVFGQNDSFTSNTANNGGRSALSLSNPRGVCIDSAGGLYVPDDNNNRVLYY